MRPRTHEAGSTDSRRNEDMVYEPAPARRSCGRCRRPLSHCLCDHIPSLANRTHVLILQHSDEARHPLNTARLAALGLRNSDVLVGEHFPELESRVASADRAWLLFPGMDGADAALPPADGAAADSALLIVPDGTWRKARRIVRVNPVLNTLPRVSLPPGQPTEYRVRKALEPAAVSTIEAIVRALEILEPGQNFQPLLRPFKVLVEQQIAAMGPEVYRRNHATPGRR